jgi:hypothetical protein
VLREDDGDRYCSMAEGEDCILIREPQIEALRSALAAFKEQP